MAGKQHPFPSAECPGSFHSVFHKRDDHPCARHDPLLSHILFIFGGFFPNYSKVILSVSRVFQMACGPRKTRTGRNNIARNNSNTPVTAMPTSRNGSSNSQTIGYSTSATSAIGQHTTNRMHHNKKAAIFIPSSFTLLLHIRRRRPECFLRLKVLQFQSPRDRFRNFRLQVHM